MKKEAIEKQKYFLTLILKEEDTKEELIKSIKKTLKMQTLIKKWDDLSIDEVQSIFGLRSEVFIVEQECPYQDIDGRDPEADHLLLYEKNILCGYTRIFPKMVQMSLW